MIKNQKIIMLVDSGSTHNFISVSVAKSLKLICSHKKQSSMTIANGEKVKTMGECSQLRWVSKGHKFVDDFRVLPVKGYDVVLGVQRLSTLGPII